jgi:hypothetical protein
MQRTAKREGAGYAGPIAPSKIFMPTMEEPSDEPLFEKLSEADQALMNAENLMLQFALTTSVSPEIRAECEQEMLEAKRKNYRRIL